MHCYLAKHKMQQCCGKAQAGSVGGVHAVTGVYGGAQDVGAEDLEADGLVRDALVVAHGALRLVQDLLADALKVVEALACAAPCAAPSAARWDTRMHDAGSCPGMVEASGVTTLRTWAVQELPPFGCLPRAGRLLHLPSTHPASLQCSAESL